MLDGARAGQRTNLLPQRQRRSCLSGCFGENKLKTGPVGFSCKLPGWDERNGSPAADLFSQALRPPANALRLRLKERQQVPGIKGLLSAPENVIHPEILD